MLVIVYNFLNNNNQHFVFNDIYLVQLLPKENINNNLKIGFPYLFFS